MAVDVSAKKMPKRLRLKTFAETFRMICGAYPVYARSPSPSQRPAPTTIASRSPFPLGLCSGQGHFVTSHFGDNMASVTWATKVSAKWVDQLFDIVDEVSLFVVFASLPSPSSNIEAWPCGMSLRFASLLHSGH